jgi:hypothetical protein
VAQARKSRRRTTKADEHETGSALIGQAFAMPEHGLGAALVEHAPIDFQARQDAIRETRRGADSPLVPKVKRTRARPAPVRETDFKP